MGDEPKVRHNKVYYEPTKYTVGPDGTISEERYQIIVAGLTDWFAKSRRTPEPGMTARQELDECLHGIKKDGSPWHGAWNATLAARVKIRCRYDIERMSGIETGSDLQKRKKERERLRLAEKRKQRRGDDLLTPELQAQMEKQNLDARKLAKYGDDPTVFLSTKEMENWNDYKASYVQQFPTELGSIAAQAELQTLCDLHILNDRHRLKLLEGKAVDPQERINVVKQLDTLKTSLGIHPNQLAKRVQSKVDTSIGAAAAKLEGMSDDWRKLKARFWLEEMLQFYQMYVEPSADGLSYQLDEVGLYGATKCRSCECAACGQRNAVGFKIDEIEDYLVKKGVLKPLLDADAG